MADLGELSAQLQQTSPPLDQATIQNLTNRERDLQQQLGAALSGQGGRWGEVMASLSTASRARDERVHDQTMATINSADVQIYELLGTGANGDVRKGRWLGTDVAVKLVRNTIGDFRIANKEARRLARISHVNIIHILGTFQRVGEFGDISLGVILEYAEHGSLESLLPPYAQATPERLMAAFGDRTALPGYTTTSLRIFLELAAALAFLHSAPNCMAHRDLKPQNLLIVRGGVVRVCDFDMARSEVSLGRSHTSLQRGTLGFMAKELLDPPPGYDVSDFSNLKSTDMFSFGRTLSAVLTGVIPQSGVPSATALPESTPDTLVRLIADCEQQDYRARPTIDAALRVLSALPPPPPAAAAAAPLAASPLTVPSFECCMRALCEEDTCTDCIRCPNDHAVCRECLPGYVDMKASEAQNLVMARGARIFCPLQGHGGCDSDTFFSDRDLMLNLDDEGWAIYRRSVEQCAEWTRERDLEATRIRMEQLSLAQQRGSDDATTALLAGVKRCPSCNMGIDHYRGHDCHHIQGCPNCGTHYCYVCLGPYTRGRDGFWHGACRCPTFCREGFDCGCPPCPDCRIGGPHCGHCGQTATCEAALREDAPRREAEAARAREAEAARARAREAEAARARAREAEAARARAREAEAARARAGEAGDESRYGPRAWAALNAARSRPDDIAKERPTANQKDSYGVTPLHLACRSNGNLELAATLLLAGADINARTSGNDTPLHYASWYGHLDTVRLLLEWGGVEVNARDSRGDTPLGYAIRRGHSEIAALLRAKGATE